MRSRYLTSHARLLVGLGAILVVAVVGTVAWATIPDSYGVYTGCYMRPDGGLRIIDASQKCKSNETRITWNKAGEQGQPGVPGKDGAGVAGFFTSFGTPTPLAVPTANQGTPPLAILAGLPNGPSFASASVNVQNGSGTAVNLICSLGEFGGAAAFDVPGNPGPGPAQAHVVLTGGSNSIGVPFGCHIWGDPANPVQNVTVSGTIEAIALTSLTVQP
jgi:hypothetical protein